MRGLVFRLYVDGQLVDEEEAATDEEAERIGRRQYVLAAGADRWLVEVWNPEAPKENAYLRFGTDPHGMVEPHAVPGPALGEWLTRKARETP